MVSPSLFNVSNHSFLKSALTIEEIIAHSLANGHRHSVITELDNLRSAYKFHSLAKSNNLIPVLGMCISYENSRYLLLAKNYLGFQNLMQISLFKDNFLNPQYQQNLIFIHLEGQDLLSDHEDSLLIDRYQANSDLDSGVFIQEALFRSKQDFPFYCSLKAINNLTTVSQETVLNQYLESCSLDSVPDLPLDSKQIKNIYEILDKCSFYDLPQVLDSLDFHSNPECLLKSILEDLFSTFSFSDPKKYRDRMEKEFEILVSQKFCSYFLIVYDAVNWAKKSGICVGPGRGSVCGSLIAYILGIIEIDPIEYSLLFERFLNPTRITFPDIDIDVASDKRELLISYLQSKYGKDNVALISVYQTFRLKNSFREISKVLEIPRESIDNLSKEISKYSDASQHNPNKTPLPIRLKKFFKEHPDVLRYIKKISNYPKALSVHPAGLIISAKPLTSFVPAISGDILRTQWTSEELKKLGLIKFDFLSLQYLTSLNNMKNQIELVTGSKLDFTTIDYKDQEVYKTIKLGHNAFIFQFESPKIQKLISRFKPTSISDLSLLSSIHRPGASDQIPNLLTRKAKVTYKTLDLYHPDFHKVLEDTYGILVYQEQLMHLVTLVLDCSFGEADTFRRNLISDESKCSKDFFESGILRYSKRDLENIWDIISKFAKYGFNKSHSVAYATISYRLLWIKTYYPTIFYSELLSFSNSQDYLKEIQVRGYRFSSPKYGKSKKDSFSIVDNIFYFPMSRISGLSSIFWEHLSKISFFEETAKKAIAEFAKSGASKEDIRLLIRSGFFSDLFTSEESEYFWDENLDSFYESLIYVDPDGNSIFDFNLRQVSPTADQKKRYLVYKSEILGPDISKKQIPISLFSKYASLSPLNTFHLHPKAKSKKEKKYIGFLSNVSEFKSSSRFIFLKIRLFDGFYTTPDLIYPVSSDSRQESEKIYKAAKNQSAAIITVVYADNFYQISKLKIV